MDPQLVAAGLFAGGRDEGIAGLVGDLVAHPFDAAVHQPGHFGKGNHLRAMGCGLGSGVAQGVDIGSMGARRGHLNNSEAERLFHEPGCIALAGLRAMGRLRGAAGKRGVLPEGPSKGCGSRGRA